MCSYFVCSCPVPPCLAWICSAGLLKQCVHDIQLSTASKKMKWDTQNTGTKCADICLAKDQTDTGRSKWRWKIQAESCHVTSSPDHPTHIPETPAEKKILNDLKKRRTERREEIRRPTDARYLV
ncbi:hypothetical protein BJY00DRAFT_28619 [Aspergillus carlsbadensis]|nr:hypothetical protein BJY00DRAFT_28619 [Aspergillus carlsbadensis]